MAWLSGRMLDLISRDPIDSSFELHQRRCAVSLRKMNLILFTTLILSACTLLWASLYNVTKYVKTFVVEYITWRYMSFPDGTSYDNAYWSSITYQHTKYVAGMRIN